MYSNLCSLIYKFLDVTAIVRHKKPSVFLISKLWLHNSIFNFLVARNKIKLIKVLFKPEDFKQKTLSLKTYLLPSIDRILPILLKTVSIQLVYVFL